MNWNKNRIPTLHSSRKWVFVVFIIFGIVQACERFEPAAPEENSLLDGPVEGLSHSQQRQFLDGDIAFNDAIFNSENGLGPIFVATSCGSCHIGDGKGHPFTTLTRFGQPDSVGNQFLHLGGPQLQNRALPGYEVEQIPSGASFSKITPPAVTGLGFLELVSDSDLLALSDPDDLDGDGISGRPNWIPIASYITRPVSAITRNGKGIGRFGKKGAALDLLQQTANAYNQDIGITSTFEPNDVFTHLDIDPEVSDKVVRDVVAYLQMLKAPIQRTPNDLEIIEGQRIFDKLKCSTCHVPTMKTGYSNIEALSNVTFHPYTDLLLHDMGAELDDGYSEGSALTSEWKTPPLWGLGLSKNSQGGQYYLLHDGRAKSIDEAIRMHGGEADPMKQDYEALSLSERNNLIKFLESL